jgi:hypothetical protein
MEGGMGLPLAVAAVQLLLWYHSTMVYLEGAVLLLLTHSRAVVTRGQPGCHHTVYLLAAVEGMAGKHTVRDPGAGIAGPTGTSLQGQACYR